MIGSGRGGCGRERDFSPRSVGGPCLNVLHHRGQCGPNQGTEPTPRSVRSAPASGRGSCPVFGCAETNRHDVKECKSPTVKD
jgi:hypothetical protein